MRANKVVRYPKLQPYLWFDPSIRPDVVVPIGSLHIQEVEARQLEIQLSSCPTKEFKASLGLHETLSHKQKKSMS